MRDQAKMGQIEYNVGENIKQIHINLDIIPNMTAMCELNRFLYE